MKITVTQEDIAKGIKGHCYECPVALAIQRTTGRDFAVMSDQIEDEQGNTVQQLINVMAEMIWDYDGTGEMPPFIFELNI